MLMEIEFKRLIIIGIELRTNPIRNHIKIITAILTEAQVRSLGLHMESIKIPSLN